VANKNVESNVSQPKISMGVKPLVMPKKRRGDTSREKRDGKEIKKIGKGGKQTLINKRSRPPHHTGLESKEGIQNKKGVGTTGFKQIGAKKKCWHTHQEKKKHLGIKISSTQVVGNHKQGGAKAKRRQPTRQPFKTPKKKKPKPKKTPIIWRLSKVVVLS